MASLTHVTALGQSVWIGWLTRDLLSSGDLERLIEEHAVSGVTTNHSVLEHALTASRAYDAQVADLVGFDLTPAQIATELATNDTTEAAMQLLPAWEASNGRDGYVSWEVDPALAMDSAATVSAVKELARRVDLPNLLVAIPATEPGLRAAEDVIAAGYGVNVTLIFSLARYAAVVESHLRGLRRAAAAGRDLSRITSVASLFISRLDSAADTRLEQERSPFARTLRGQLGIASAKLAYRHYRACYSGPSWQELHRHGARPQRLAWVSTSPRNAANSDVRYIEELIGPETVTTVCRATLEAFIDHGRVAETLTHDVERAALTLADLAVAGLDLRHLTDELEQDGIARLVRSREALKERIASQQRQAQAA